MDLLAAEQLTTPTGDHPGMPDRAERRSGPFGCLPPIVGVLSGPRQSVASLPGVATEPERRGPADHHEDGPR
jgi:hypothetical protein